MTADKVNQFVAASVFLGLGLIMLLESAWSLRERFKYEDRGLTLVACSYFAAGASALGVFWWIWHSTLGIVGPN